jgi:hypothetical protein
MNTPPAQRLSHLGLIVFSVVLGLAALELGLRAWRGYLEDWSNLVLDARTVHAAREGARFVHDQTLGYVPKSGLRGNGNGPPAAGPSLLAVGDSFTYGEEVADGETWPAALQRLTGRPVLNGGVSGYGFDQTVLRAEALARSEAPATIVVSFIADDIRRTEMRRIWGADKPYFEIKGGALVLANVPVPPRLAPRESLTLAQRTLGHSYLFDFVLRRLDLLHDWFGDHLRALPEGTGERVACLLTERLAALQARTGARVILLAQYDAWAWQSRSNANEQRRMVAGLLECARRQNLLTIDTFDALSGHGAPAKLYGLWHMNAEGNHLVAKIVEGQARW